MRWRGRKGRQGCDGGEGRGGAEERETQRKRDKQRETERQRGEKKREWNIKISGHVFVTSGPISCMVTHACPHARVPAGMFTHTPSVHLFLSRFLHKQKVFIVLPCAQSPNHFF